MEFFSDMKSALPCLALAVGILLAPSAAKADLPILKEQPWLGYFIGIEHKRKMSFGVTAKGLGVLNPLKKNNEPVYLNNPIQINFDVIETTPDGKTVRKEIKPDSLTSDQKAVENPDSPVTFRGKVTGDAAFEVTITPDRDGFSVSGRLTDKGTLTNPLHFAISADFSPYVTKPGGDPAEMKRFKERAKRDSLNYETVSRKKGKIEFLDNRNPADTVTEGIGKAEVSTDSYDGIDFELVASDKSKLAFHDKGAKPLWDGFTLRWSANEGVDSTTQKLTITAK